MKFIAFNKIANHKNIKCDIWNSYRIYRTLLNKKTPLYEEQ